MRHIPLSLAIAVTAAVPPLAAQPSAPPASQQVEVEGQRLHGRAGQVICRVLNVTGSRLRQQRACVTRQQWTDQRERDRALVEKAQTNRIWPSG